MNRRTVQPGQIPLAEDFLMQNRYVLQQFGALNSLLNFGNQNIWEGFELSNIAGTMSVRLQPGALMSSDYAFDNTPYGSLPSTTETCPILATKTDETTLTFAPTATSGQSQAFLIEAALQQTDTSPVVRPYYNASNPSQAYAGPNNSGDATNTLRKTGVAINVKAGTPATTGTQTTPTTTPNYIPLYTVTFPGGATSIANATIAKVASHSLPLSYRDLSQGFTASKATNGYQRYPSGVIEQWGIASTSAAGTVSVTFPIPFPNACFGVQCTHGENQPIARSFGAGNVTQAGFLGVASSAAAGTFYWSAKGH